MVGLQRVAEPVDDEELDAIDGSVAEGGRDIAPEAESDDVADDADEPMLLLLRGPDIRPFLNLWKTPARLGVPAFSF